MPTPTSDFFGYTNPRGSSTRTDSDKIAAIEEALGIGPDGKPIAGIGKPGLGVTQAGAGVKKGGSLSGLLKKLRALGNIPIQEIKEDEKSFEKMAPEYASYLGGQIQRGGTSNKEAADAFINFGITHNVPDVFKTAEKLASLTQGQAAPETVERYRDYQKLAANQLGISLSEEDIKSTEAAALSLGKTTPEAFSQFLGAKMLSSPEYIRKNPLAMAANLPFGGKYGIGYQTPQGTFTGTYRFKPPSTVDYS
jgi:hypothetical protein